jgi:beta-lactamase superfamily II metal-dependent hydrolase
MRRLLFCTALLLVVVCVPTDASQRLNGSLMIYWIDVEGGAATLLVTPTGQSVLMDAGWARPDERDTRRIRKAMQDAEIDTIDYFITSHYHGDHVGGLTTLASQVSIGEFLDHGESVEQGSERGHAAWSGYLAAAGDKRRSVKPGDKLPLRGLEFSFVVAHADPLGAPLMPLGPNPHCEGASAGPDDFGENARSVGYLVSLGAFQFLDLGDITVNVQHMLACPVNKLGNVDVYQVPHHGNGLAPQLTWALAPTVAIINNGPHKGGDGEGFQVVAATPGIEDIWQLHRALDTDAAFRTDDALTANTTDEDGCEGHWIKAVVSPDGRSYSLSNGRTGDSRTYLSQ